MNTHHPYDPESLLTGAEEAAGMNYDNSRRHWPDDATQQQAIAGNLSPEEILRLAPRALMELPKRRTCRTLRITGQHAQIDQRLTAASPARQAEQKGTDNT